MSSETTGRLYGLLPSIHRIKDAAQGEPLRALLAVIEAEFERLRQDVDGLYSDWFIETCDEELVSYIGDLLRVRGLHPVTARNFSQRAYVANTLGYRRRKGTATVLEQLARDVTGWPARATEFCKLLTMTQWMNHVRLHAVATPRIGEIDAMELLSGPFETTTHTPDVRRIASRRGKYNLTNVGIFLWRLESYPVERGTARGIPGSPDGLLFAFNPLGLDAPLFNRPQTETEITHLAEEINVPGILRRRALYDELEARRQAIVDGATPDELYFGATPVLEVFASPIGSPERWPEEIPPEEIEICDLSTWKIPAAEKSYRRSDDPADVRSMPIRVAVDPLLGRLSFPSEHAPAKVQVSYSFGFSDDVGAGPYDREESIETELGRIGNDLDKVAPDLHLGVTRDPEALDSPFNPGQMMPTLNEAIQAWNAAAAPRTFGLITILDSDSYEETLDVIEVPEGSRLAIVAADWPRVENDLGQEIRIDGRINPVGVMPHVLADLAVRGTAPDRDPGELIVDGLLVEGRLTVLDGNLGRLRLAHATLVPDLGGLDVVSGNDRLVIEIERAIVGPLVVPDTIERLEVADSILHASASPGSSPPSAASPMPESPPAEAIAWALAGDPLGEQPGPACTIERTTVFGGIHAREMTLVSETILTEPSIAERVQQGCVRFSHVPRGSRTPRRYRCQPDLVLEDVDDPAEQARLVLLVKPLFTSTRYGDPGYAQLARTCAEEIRTGAEDGSEIGVFSSLKQPQRESNLQSSLDEYLRFGLEAGSFFVT